MTVADFYGDMVLRLADKVKREGWPDLDDVWLTMVQAGIVRMRNEWAITRKPPR